MSTTIDPVLAAVEDASTDLAAAAGTALAHLGDRLGLWRALADGGPATPVELAGRTGCGERHLREWLACQAAGGWLRLDPETGRYRLDEAYAAVFADEGSPVFLGGSLQVVAALWAAVDQLEEAFRHDVGIAWGDQHADLHEGVARFSAIACGPYLGAWLSEVDGVAEALAAGGTALDLGCGGGSGAVALAQAFPAAEVLGIDAHEPSIAAARGAAATAGVEDRVRFACRDLTDLPPGGADVAVMVDCLHDLGDPVGAAAAARAALRPGAPLVVVEPAAGDRVEDNLHPVGRMYYASSTAFCTPCALAQPGGWALGTQAGPARLRDVLLQAGFAEVREVARTPWQLVLEAR